jgi:hypothetical protein
MSRICRMYSAGRNISDPGSMSQDGGMCVWGSWWFFNYSAQRQRPCGGGNESRKATTDRLAVACAVLLCFFIFFGREVGMTPIVFCLVAAVSLACLHGLAHLKRRMCCRKCGHIQQRKSIGMRQLLRLSRLLCPKCGAAQESHPKIIRDETIDRLQRRGFYFPGRTSLHAARTRSRRHEIKKAEWSRQNTTKPTADNRNMVAQQSQAIPQTTLQQRQAPMPENESRHLDQCDTRDPKGTGICESSFLHNEKCAATGSERNAHE